MRKAVREHLDLAMKLLREGGAVRDSLGVTIEARYRQAAFLAAAEELKAATTLIERVARATTGSQTRQ